MVKYGQTWHYLAKTALEGVKEITPKELGTKIGASPIRAAALLRSLGWIRERVDNHTILFRVPLTTAGVS